MTFVVGLVFVPETKGRDISGDDRRRPRGNG
jgi:hypothetical protein